MRDFTIEMYNTLCSTLLDSSYVPVTLSEYLMGCNHDRTVIIRHDVDLSSKAALKVAEFEYKNNIKSTYYLRYPKTFDLGLIKQLVDQGHEVGYHYETLSKAKGDFEKAIKIFQEELLEFRDVCNVNTICMHGSPVSKYDNRSIWNKYCFKDFGIIGEAYLSINGIGYFSDTGRSWDGKNSMRDRISGEDVVPGIKTTEDLKKYIMGNNEDSIYITIHPERWASNNSEWLFGLLFDYTINFGKKAIGVLR